MNKSKGLKQLADMLRIRRFEEQLIALARGGQEMGHYHVYIGQEATAVAACATLSAEDFAFSTWRNHGHLLARGAAPARMMAEILGRSGGYAGGRSGTLHLSVNELGMPSTSALVGGSLPLATGAALACKRRGSGIAVAFFGDAGMEEGACYEAMVVAQIWQVPILFICENNSTPPQQGKRMKYTSTLPSARLGDVPMALQIPSESVDGTDADALAACFTRLAAEVRGGGGPRFVEVCCSRWPGSIMTWPELPGGEWQLAWAFGQGQPEHAGMAAWLESDPLLRYLRKLYAAGIVDRVQAEAMDAKVRAEMNEAVQFALDSPFPAAAEAYRHVLAEVEAS